MRPALKPTMTENLAELSSRLAAARKPDTMCAGAHNRCGQPSRLSAKCLQELRDVSIVKGLMAWQHGSAYLCPCFWTSYQVLAAVQVYAVGGRGATGAVSVTMACRAPEVLFESAPEYGGVTGLWSLPARLGDAQHALAVLAFADTSRALAAGALLTHHLAFCTWKAVWKVLGSAS